ncbi:MAG: lipid-A-disaccharide synthase [Acidobacteriota bacterium]
MASHDLLIVAGEASGDLHGARLLSELRKLKPEIVPFGLGGDELQAAGLDSPAHSSEISVVGITEVIKIYARAKQIFNELLAEVDRRQAKAAVLIDFPDFNLRLAKALAQRGVTVVYYISPQIWAWRKGRVKTIERVVEKMLVVLPFEVDFYRQHAVDAVFVGHPLVDEVPRLPHIWERDLPASGPFEIALLPGSRTSEVDRLLPILLDAAQRIAAQLPVRFTLIRAPTIDLQDLEARLAVADVEIRIASEDRYRQIAESHLALCASGTASLEVGLVGTPEIVVYRVTRLTYLIGKMLADFKFASLVNLLSDREVVPELIQNDAEPKLICEQAVALLKDRERIRQMRESLAQLSGRLGTSGASRRAAEEVASCLAKLPD